MPPIPRPGAVRAATVGLALALAPLALAGCSEEVTRESAVASFAAANPEASETQSACVVDRLLERYTLDELGTELSAESPDPAFEEAQFTDMFLCGVEGDVTEQIVDQLVEAGIAEEDAPCVADELVGSLTEDDIGVLLSGEITDSFADKFYAAAETCEALDGS